VAPLILITIGALFLANNIRPGISVMDIIARFWPYVLICWGGIRLLELAYTAVRGRPLPPSGISGGEWVLVVFITLIGSGVYTINKHVGWWSPMHIRIKGVEVFGDTFDFPIEERHVPLNTKTPKLVVEHSRGNVRIAGTDASDINVLGRKTIRAMKQEEAEKAHDETPLEIETRGDTIYIRTTHGRSHGERFISSDLEITAPRSISVEARGNYGDFDFVDIAGDVKIDSDNAGVRLERIGGSVAADVRRSDIVRAVDVKGDVDLKGSRANDVELENIQGQVVISGGFFGDMQFRNLAKPLRIEDSGRAHAELRVERTPGQLRVGRGYIEGADLVGPVIVNARSKDVNLSDFTAAVEVQVERGDIELRPGKLPLPKIDVSTQAGRIELAVPEGARFALRATAHRGEITNDFGEPLKVSHEGDGATLTGTVGDGPALTLTTERGSVTVRKGSGSGPLTPAPPQAPRAPRTPPQTL
jgi:DUF4097 and DUF4098 domain-containing protein YvlB